MRPVPKGGRVREGGTPSRGSGASVEVGRRQGRTWRCGAGAASKPGPASRCLLLPCKFLLAAGLWLWGGLAHGSPGADIRRGVPPRSPPSQRQRKARLHARCKGRRLPRSNRFVPTSLVWSKAQLCIQSGKAQRPAERRAQQDQTREASKRLQQEVRGVVRLEVLVRLYVTRRRNRGWAAPAVERIIPDGSENSQP